MIISHHRRFIFMKTSKTAGSSIEMALSVFCGENDVLTRLSAEEEEERGRMGGRTCQHDRWPLARSGWRQWRRFIRGYRYADAHTRANDAKLLAGDDVWSNYFKFAFVRNPWDRTVSHWFWRCKTEPRPTLQEFIASKNMRGMNKRGLQVYTINGKIIVDRLCRYENLAEELTAVAQHLGFEKPLTLPNAKGAFRKDRRHYSEWYDNESRDRVAELFAEEIALTGYQFEDRR